MFAEQVVDIDYLRLRVQNEGDTYTNDENKVQLFREFKFINQVLHRMDNKYIEIFLEEMDKHLPNIDHIVSMIRSLGDRNILEVAKDLEFYWSFIKNYMNDIKFQSKDEIFKIHAAQREKTSNQWFERITSELPQD